jgi:hypothetical protein
MMNKSQLISLSLNGLKREVVEIAGGECVTVREMTAGERDGYQLKMMATDARGQLVINPDTKQPVIDAGKVAQARLWLVAYCTLGESGTRMFEDGDIELIAQMPNEIVEKIAAAARRLSGLDDGAVDDAVKG